MTFKILSLKVKDNFLSAFINMAPTPQIKTTHKVK